jgi:hypothetical protein
MDSKRRGHLNQFAISLLVHANRIGNGREKQ